MLHCPISTTPNGFQGLKKSRNVLLLEREDVEQDQFWNENRHKADVYKIISQVNLKYEVQFFTRK